MSKTATSVTSLYEFVWRDNGNGAAWHVRLKHTVTLPSGAAHVAPDDALTPDQAAAAGFPLSKVLADINHDALAQVASLTDAHDAKDTELAQMAAEATALRVELDKVKGERDVLQLQLTSRKMSHAVDMAPAPATAEG